MRVSVSSEVAEAEPAVYPDRPYLRVSRQLSWDRVPGTPAAQSAVAALLAQMLTWEPRQRARRADDEARLEGTLGAVALDLLVAGGEDPEMWLAYSRRNEDYEAAKRRYIHPVATRLVLGKVADFLTAAGYADGKAGSYQRREPGGTGYRSRLRATDRLVAFFTGRGVGLADVGVREGAELVILKDTAVTRGAQKPLLGYEDTPATKRMRDELKAWAAVANRHDIRPPQVRWDPTDRLQEDAGWGAGEAVERHRARLYRVFNNGSWAAGGRFYGGWWMTMPSELRRGITIDGESVVELDFKALHPRLAYHLSGQPVARDEDPYDLGPEWRDLVHRDDVKVAFNKLLAVGPGGKPKKPKDLALPRGATYPALLAALGAKHEPIRGWLRAGRALELQNLDSRIAERVLGYFTARGRPVLPVHDSFVVAKRDERMLGETMHLAYWAALKDLSGVRSYPVVKGWSSPEIEEQLVARLGEVDALVGDL